MSHEIQMSGSQFEFRHVKENGIINLLIVENEYYFDMKY